MGCSRLSGSARERNGYVDERCDADSCAFYLPVPRKSYLLAVITVDKKNGERSRTHPVYI